MKGQGRAALHISALLKRSISSSASSTGPTIVTGPAEKLKSWESGAKIVKNTKVENQYLDHIRDMHDPSLHLKTLEDELKGTIGAALGKQGEKILSTLRLMEEEKQKYYELLEDHGPNCRVAIESAKQHNEYRQQCMKARWELIVHRQAVGFIVGNHKFVMEKFPIGDALPEDVVEDAVDDATDDESTTKTDFTAKRKFGDQLDWWERVGRWK